MTLFEHLHFTRHYWLLFIPMLMILQLAVSHRRTPSSLPKLVSPALLPILEIASRGGSLNRWLGIISAYLFIIGLAGISFVTKSAQMFESTNKTVFVIDQSLSMYATDLQPNRQTKLMQTMRDILNAQQDGEVALVAYAGDAFVISPFSQDKQTLIHLLLALDPTIMPIYGSNMLKAVEAAKDLLKQQDSRHGHIVIFADDVKLTELAGIQLALDSVNAHTDVITFGTRMGAKVILPNNETLKDYGREVIPMVPEDRFETLADAGNVTWYRGPLDSEVIEKIATYSNTLGGEAKTANGESHIWQESGQWFAIPFLVWLAWQFRRGGLFAVVIYLGSNNPAEAGIFDWIYSPDQLGQIAVDNGDWETAASQFKRLDWKAASDYAQENYAAAIDALTRLEKQNEALGGLDAKDDYNLGNALALNNDIDNAIKAYQSALEKDPDFNEAKENLAYLETLRKQQEQSQPQSNGNDGQQDAQQDQQNTGADHSDSEKNSSDSSQQSESHGEARQGDTSPIEENQAYAQQQEDDLALEQWMRQIQDDPGSLLKRKLWYLHQERRNENRFRQENGEKPW